MAQFRDGPLPRLVHLDGQRAQIVFLDAEGEFRQRSDDRGNGKEGVIVIGARPIA
jgi:hypothetical protein